MPRSQSKIQTRREILKKAAYVAPAVVTMKVAPAFAARGSGITVVQPPIRTR